MCVVTGIAGWSDETKLNFGGVVLCVSVVRGIAGWSEERRTECWPCLVVCVVRGIAG